MRQPHSPTLERTAQGLQRVLPGAERSAQQAMAAREAKGHGRIPARVPQLPPGGLFEPREAEQPDLFGYKRADWRG